MSDTTIPLSDQLAAVQREIGMRRKAYPRWVQLGRMTQQQADRELAVMEAVRGTLTKLHSDEIAKDTPGLF